MRYSDEELQAILPTVLRTDKAGRLFWLTRPVEMFNGKNPERVCAAWNTRFAGKEAFTAVRPDGYLGGAIFGRNYLAHRVVWALIFGRWPMDLDHKNHNGADNRPINLREVSHVQNMRNQSHRRTSTSGVMGVSAFRGKWQAHITVGGKKHNLGTYRAKGDAVAARVIAAERFGFHPNHGAVAA